MRSFRIHVCIVLYSDGSRDNDDTQVISLDEESDEDNDEVADTECESPDESDPAGVGVPRRRIVNRTLLKNKKTTKKHVDDGAVPSTSREETQAPTATQRITVRKNRRGYTTYPAYLFDVPPTQLGIDNLRRQYLIAEIERSKKENLYYDNAISFIGFMKESVRSIAECNGFNLTRPSQ